MFVALGSPLLHFILFMGSSSQEHIHGAMPTYVRLVDTKRLGIPRHVSSPLSIEERKKKKKRYSDRAVRPCSFLLDVIFLGFFYIKLHKVLAYLALALRI
jgi:hypothetical protein